MASIAPEKIGSLTAPEVEHAPDKIGHDGCKDLAGHTFEYTYSSGVHYRISFDEEKAYFSLPWRIDGLTYGGLSYRARAVALVFDLTHKRVDAAALMPGKFELFDRATFDEFKSGGEGALYHKSPEEEIDPW